MPVPSLGQEDPLEKLLASHASVLAWRIPMDRGAWRATVHGGHKEWDKTEATWPGQYSLSRTHSRGHVSQSQH